MKLLFAVAAVILAAVSAAPFSLQTNTQCDNAGCHSSATRDGVKLFKRQYAQAAMAAASLAPMVIDMFKHKKKPSADTRGLPADGSGAPATAGAPGSSNIAQNTNNINIGGAANSGQNSAPYPPYQLQQSQQYQQLSPPLDQSMQPLPADAQQYPEYVSQQQSRYQQGQQNQQYQELPADESAPYPPYNMQQQNQYEQQASSRNNQQSQQAPQQYQQAPQQYQPSSGYQQRQRKSQYSP